MTARPTPTGTDITSAGEVEHLRACLKAAEYAAKCWQEAYEQAEARRATPTSAELAPVSGEVVERAFALLRRIAAKEPWQSHYGKTWEEEASEILSALTQPQPSAGEGFWPAARLAFAMEVSAIERDVRLSELTADEIDAEKIAELEAFRETLWQTLKRIEADYGALEGQLAEAQFRLGSLGASPDMSPDLAELCAALGTMVQPGHKSWPTHYRNPDGARAAAAIEGLNAKCADLSIQVQAARAEERARCAEIVEERLGASLANPIAAAIRQQTGEGR